MGSQSIKGMILQVVLSAGEDGDPKDARQRHTLYEPYHITDHLCTPKCTWCVGIMVHRISTLSPAGAFTTPAVWLLDQLVVRAFSGDEGAQPAAWLSRSRCRWCIARPRTAQLIIHECLQVSLVRQFAEATNQRMRPVEV